MTPGEFIREEIEERGWTPDELARRMNRPTELATRLLSGSWHIDVATATVLGSAFGTSAELWLNMQRRSDAERKR